MRTVTIFDTQSSSTRTHSSNATTWGQLKRELGIGDNTKGVLRQGKQTLQSSEAELPESDFFIFLFPDKVKSGFDADAMVRDMKTAMTEVFDEILQNIEDGDYGDTSSARGEDIDALREAKRIQDEMGG